MTRAMHEVLAETRSRDHLACGTIDALTRRTDTSSSHACRLGREQHVVGLRDVARDLPRHDAPRDVGAVPVHRSTEVTEHDLVLGDHA